jgi:sulfur carrier protein ThiS adenylyltransferase
VANLIPTKEEWNHALIDRHGEGLYQKFSSATVAVCGLGGLGSNIAITLARAGIGKLILIDFDRVDITNLHRQQYKANQIGRYKTDAFAENLLEIAPYTEIKTLTTKITENNLVDLLRDADIVCEAFDNAESKAMLVNGVLEQLPDCFLVAASGMAGMDTPNTIKTRKIVKGFYLCGDETSDVADTIGLVATRVLLCAAHQAHTVLRILAGEYEV